MNLSSQGVRVRFDVAGAGAEPGRLRLSSGTEKAEGAGGGIPYQKPCIVPSRQWREPNAEERAILLSSNGSEDLPGTTICVTRVPQAFLEAFGDFRAKLTGSIASCVELTESAPYQRCVQRAVAALSEYFASHEGIRVLGTCVNAPGLRAATTHLVGADRYRSGLHVDNWDLAPLAERQSCRSKFCVNLGLCSRYFLFVNRPVGDFVREFPAAAAANDPRASVAGLAVALMERYPSYPVVSVLLRPGEAYFAPTENIIHDGSTEGAEHPDVTFNLLGYLNMAAFAETARSAISAA
jgi:hypothetical protein